MRLVFRWIMILRHGRSGKSRGGHANTFVSVFIGEPNPVSDAIGTLSLSRNQAAFLQTVLSRLATTTRQAMTGPGLDPKRHGALLSRAVVLEIIDDAVRSAMLELPNSTRKSACGVEVVAAARIGRPPPAGHGSRQQPLPKFARPVVEAADAQVEPKVRRCRSNAWLAAFLGERQRCQPNARPRHRGEPRGIKSESPQRFEDARNIALAENAIALDVREEGTPGRCVPLRI
jgi:hypothetical protein